MTMKINKLSGTDKSSMAKMAGSASYGAGGMSGPSSTRTPARQPGAATMPGMSAMPMARPKVLGGVKR